MRPDVPHTRAQSFEPSDHDANASGQMLEETEKTLLNELEGLSPLEYDRRREAAADKLGVRVTALDREVDLRRPRHDDAKGQGRALQLLDPEPWPESVDGAALLNMIVAILQRFLALPKNGAEAMALWILHAHAHEAADIAPRLVFTSPLPRCGKTTALSIIGRLVPRPLLASNITAAAVFRVIEAAKPTLIIDEADTFIKDSDELKGVLNSGHTRETAHVVRTAGDDHEPRAFMTWAPVAVAMIGRLPPTLEDRSIVVPMQRRAPNQIIERLRRNRLDELADIASMAARWAADNFTSLKGDDPMVPKELHDRAADNWEPLFSIADLAGGDWPARARKAARALSGSADEALPAAQLLADIKALFEERRVDRLPSTTICEVLSAMEDRPWPEWGRNSKPITTHALSRLLKPFGISPGTIRMGPTDTAKGYMLERFKEAFTSYLPDPPSQSATPPQVKESADHSDFQTVTSPPDVTVVNLPKAAGTKGCDVVTVERGGNGEEGREDPEIEELTRIPDFLRRPRPEEQSELADSGEDDVDRWLRGHSSKNPPLAKKEETT